MKNDTPSSLRNGKTYLLEFSFQVGRRKDNLAADGISPKILDPDSLRALQVETSPWKQSPPPNSVKDPLANHLFSSSQKVELWQSRACDYIWDFSCQCFLEHDNLCAVLSFWWLKEVGLSLYKQNYHLLDFPPYVLRISYSSVTFPILPPSTFTHGMPTAELFVW